MKYKLINPTLCGREILYRIQKISNGELGGWIESEKNLSQDGTCWIGKGCEVTGESRILNDAQIKNWAKIAGNVVVKDNAVVGGHCQIEGKVFICGDSSLEDFVSIQGLDITIKDRAHLYGSCQILHYAIVQDSAKIGGNVVIKNSAIIAGESHLKGDVWVGGSAVLKDVNLSHAEKIRYNMTGNSTLEKMKGTFNIFPDGEGYYLLYKSGIKKDDCFYSCFGCDSDKKYRLGVVTQSTHPYKEESVDDSAIFLFNPDSLYIQPLQEGEKIFQCKVALKDIINVPRGTVRAVKCTPIKEI